MRCSRNLLAPAVALVASVAALAQTPAYNLGRSPTAEEIRAWDISIGPEGKELPPGSGTAPEGAQIYAARCAKCHGQNGETPFMGYKRLIGPKGLLTTPTKDFTHVRTIGNFWPYATTIFDYIRRAMPQKEEGSLSADEVYALTAFLLYRNEIIPENYVIDAKTLPKIQMPNRNGFVPAKPEWSVGGYFDPGKARAGGRSGAR